MGTLLANIILEQVAAVRGIFGVKIFRASIGVVFVFVRVRVEDSWMPHTTHGCHLCIFG